MVLCHKWNAKNDFAYVLQFFSLISDGLGSVDTMHRANFGSFFLPCEEEEFGTVKAELSGGRGEW